MPPVNNAPPVDPSAALALPFRVAVLTVLGFGLIMQALLIGGVLLARRTIDHGVAPMQEVLLIQRHALQALQLVKGQDPLQQPNCDPLTQDEVCKVPLLLQNIVASAQRLLDGKGGLAGLPSSRTLEGDPRTVAQTLRERTEALLPISTPRVQPTPDQLLQLQAGMQDIYNQAHRLEQLVLVALQQGYRTKHWLDLLGVTGAGLLMAATLVALFWMWARVRDAFQQLQNSQARLRAYADAVPDTAYVLDINGRVMEIMGRPQDHSDRPVTMPLGTLLQEHRPADLVNTYLRTIRRALATREVQTLETELEDVRGEKRWFEARVAVIERSVSEPTKTNGMSQGETADQVIWLSREVSGRIQTEQQLRQLNDELEHRVSARTRELNDAAEELRRFNYTVSHDLRAPLRAVEAYTALAVEEAGESLNAGARDLLERARKSAAQLSHMVEGLLQLSRIGEIPLQCSWLDFSAMVSEICMAFGLDQKERRIEWHITPSLTAWADEHLMRSVLQNLISNAVKYSAHRVLAHIEFGQAQQSDGTAAFFVRDNGAGFDMAHASQLFQPFTRLHSAKDFAGDGIGLATVRRIVMRHGGRIWAQSQVGAGATIYFTLPAPARERERDFSGSRPAPLEFDSRPAPLRPDFET